MKSLVKRPNICLTYFKEKLLVQNTISIADLSLKKCSGLIGLQLDSLIWETASPRNHKPQIVNESLLIVSNQIE